MEEKLQIETTLGRLAVRMCGDGPTALLWHSLLVDETSWDRVIPELSGQRRLVLITGPGHGESADPDRRYTLQECAEAAVTILDALGVYEPVDWVGNAWGGHVGVLFAAGWPERCRTLTMVGSPIQALSRPERMRMFALLATHRLFGPVGFIQEGATAALLSPATRAQDPDAVALVKRCLSKADPAALRNAVVSISIRRPDLSEELPHVSAPTLLVTGTDHEGWTPAQARTACALLPDARTAVVPDAAYLMPLEAPAETARLTMQFWAASGQATVST
ncbi:MAG TPA: alpha/beta hydrolase [Nocardioidaceae bacterium]|nr:alpha/beta hydrolase [Nocardioidaceae bacterium]